jgi:hypothetical protein
MAWIVDMCQMLYVRFLGLHGLKIGPEADGKSWFWDNDAKNYQKPYFLHLCTKLGDLKGSRCAMISSTIDLWTPEATKVWFDHMVRLSFEVYYDRPLYPTGIRKTVKQSWVQPQF